MRPFLLMFVLSFACGREVVDPPPKVKVPVEVEKVEEPSKPEPGPRAPDMVEEAYELGRRTERIKQQTEEAQARLEDMSRVAAFIHCLERRTGKKIRGDDGTMERHMRGKHGRACRREVMGMTSDEVLKHVAETIPE